MKTYFIATVGLKFFKVGRSANPTKRLRTVQTGCPSRCVLVATLRVDRELEIGTALRFHRAHGEWFIANREALLILGRLGCGRAARGIKHTTRSGQGRGRVRAADPIETPIDAYLWDARSRAAIDTLACSRSVA